jgi:putative NADPH-quinone reductase
MRVVAICGSYRQGGAIDQAIEAVLEGARERGAETRTFHLREQRIEFCTNCRQCMQKPGEEWGKCVQKDDLEKILADVKRADAIVLGSPVNCYNVTAIFRRWMERLVGSGYWPWGQPAPKARKKTAARRAVLVASSAMPGFLIPLASGAARALKLAATLLNARPVGSMWMGLVAQNPQYELTQRLQNRARKLGWKLAQG